MFALKVDAEVKGQMSDGLQGEQHLLVELGEGLHLGGQGEEPKGTVVLAQRVWEKTRGCGHKNRYMYTVEKFRKLSSFLVLSARTLILKAQGSLHPVGECVYLSSCTRETLVVQARTVCPLLVDCIHA